MGQTGMAVVNCGRDGTNKVSQPETETLLRDLGGGGAIWEIRCEGKTASPQRDDRRSSRHHLDRPLSRRHSSNQSPSPMRFIDRQVGEH